MKCQISMDNTVSLLLFIEINVSERIPQCNLIFIANSFLFMHLMRGNLFYFFPGGSMVNDEITNLDILTSRKNRNSVLRHSSEE